MKNKYIYTIVLFCIVSGLIAVSAYSQGTANINLEPDAIHMGAAYNGMEIAVTGEIPAGTDAVVRVVAPGEDVHLKKKGKALGFLWMNMDTVVFHNCPSVFIVCAPKAFSPASQADEKKWENLGLGVKAIEKQIKISPEQTDPGRLFTEFIKLKKKEGKYLTNYDGIKYANENNQTRSFSVKIAMPASLKTGEYSVELFVVKDDAVVGNVHKAIQADLVGIPKMLSSLAFNHSLLYGIMAVVIALVAGLITGLVFKGGKGAH